MFVGGAAVAATGAASGLSTTQTFAKAPLINKQAPYFYRFKIGTIEATVVSDGALALGVPSGWFVGASEAELKQMLTDNFLPADNVSVQQNILVLNTGDKLVMFDCGLGAEKLYGPNSGRLLESLRQAGIDPNDIDAIVITHAHPDHTWGIMAEGGKRNFPNAQYYIDQTEFEFWTDEAKLAIKDPPIMKLLVEGSRKHLLPNRDRTIFVKDGQEILPGIQAMSTPGHTIGHMSYMVTSGGKTLAVVGDTTHHPVLLFQNPRFEFMYDTDRKLSVKTRIRMLDMLAANRTPMLAYHFPWPGIGYTAKRGDGYQYHPAEMQMIL